MVSELGGQESRVIVIGAVHWDWICRVSDNAELGQDLPGTISRRPGGVGFNLALAIAENGIQASLIGAIGNDFDGDVLKTEVGRFGLAEVTLEQNHSVRTDQYVAVESMGRLVIAVADCRCLESSVDRLTDVLENRLALAISENQQVTLVMDGNLPIPIIEGALGSRNEGNPAIRFVVASAAKARSACSLVNVPRVTIYLNRNEAEMIANSQFQSAADAANALVKMGFERAIVTNAEQPAADCTQTATIHCDPFAVGAMLPTGAGDRFSGAHTASELLGLDRLESMKRAHKFAKTTDHAVTK